MDKLLGLNPWAILGGFVAVLLLVVSAFFYGQHVEGLEWQVKIDAQKMEAANLLAAEKQKIIDKEREWAAKQSGYEAQHAKDQTAILGALGRNNGIVADLLRRSNGCGAGGAPGMPETAPGTSGAPGPSAGQPDVLSGQSGSGPSSRLAARYNEADQFLSKLRLCVATLETLQPAP